MDHRRLQVPGSSLPVPNSVQKTPVGHGQKGKRMSMLRQSLGGGFRPPVLQSATKPDNHLTLSAASKSLGSRRQSVRPAANPLLASAQKPARTPLHPASMKTPRVITTQSDDRPLRDKPYQAKLVREIVAYTAENGFNITFQALINTPTLKDFSDLFHFLYNQIFDPGHTWDPRAKINDEFVPLLKTMRYPYLDQVTKGLGGGVVAPHSWPALLGMLHWIVEYAKVENAWAEAQSDPIFMDNLPADFSNAFLPRIFFDFTADAWEDFLDGKDHFPGPEAALNSVLEQRFQIKLATLEEHEKEQTTLRQEVAELSKPSPQEELDEEMRVLEEELDKLKEQMVSFSTKHSVAVDNISQTEHDILMLENEKIAQEHRLAEVQEELKRQNLSPDEVSRLRHDREAFERNFDDLKYKYNNVQSLVREREIEFFCQSETVENLVTQFENHTYELGLHPNPPPPFEEGSFRIVFNSATDDLKAMLVGPDLSTEMRRNLLRYIDSMRKALDDAEKEKIQLENELDMLETETEAAKQATDALANDLDSRLVDIDQVKQKSAEGVSIVNNEIEGLQRELTKIKTHNQNSAIQLSTKVEALKIEQAETREKVRKLKERTIAEIIENVNEINKTKMYVSEQLEHLARMAKEDEARGLEED